MNNWYYCSNCDEAFSIAGTFTYHKVPACKGRLVGLYPDFDKPTDGSWEWALEQIKQGKRVRRPLWPAAAFIAASYEGEPVKMHNKVNIHNSMGWHVWGAHVADYDAIDWELVD